MRRDLFDWLCFALLACAVLWSSHSQADCATDWIAADQPSALTGYHCTDYIGGCQEQIQGSIAYVVNSMDVLLYQCSLSTTAPPPPTSGPASDGSTGCVAGVPIGWDMAASSFTSSTIQIEQGGCVFDLSTSGYNADGSGVGGLALSTGQATGTGAGGGGGGTPTTGGAAPAAALAGTAVTGNQDTTDWAAGTSEVQWISSVQQTVGSGASAIQVTTTCATLSGVTSSQDCVSQTGSGSLSGVASIPYASLIAPSSGGAGGGTGSGLLSGGVSDPGLLSAVQNFQAFVEDSGGLSGVAPPSVTPHTLSDVQSGLLDGSFAALKAWTLPERSVSCPTWDYNFTIYGTNFSGTYDAQCTVWNAVGDTVSVIALLGWGLAALFIVLSA